MRGFLKFLAGDLAGARVDLERALDDYDERRDESLRTLFALDLRSNALMHVGDLAWHLGNFEEADRLTDEALRRAKELLQPGSYATALFTRLVIGAQCGEAEAVLPAAEEMRALAEEHDLKFWRATASTYPAGAVSAYREALSVARAQGSRALALMAALALAKLLQSTKANGWMRTPSLEKRSKALRRRPCFRRSRRRRL
jgi:hypothetical protein